MCCPPQPAAGRRHHPAVTVGCSTRGSRSLPFPPEPFPDSLFSAQGQPGRFEPGLGQPSEQHGERDQIIGASAVEQHGLRWLHPQPATARHQSQQLQRHLHPDTGGQHREQQRQHGQQSIPGRYCLASLPTSCQGAAAPVVVESGGWSAMGLRSVPPVRMGPGNETGFISDCSAPGWG